MCIKHAHNSVATSAVSSMTNVEVCKNLVPDTSLVPSTHTMGLHVEPSSVNDVLLLIPVTEI